MNRKVVIGLVLAPFCFMLVFCVGIVAVAAIAGDDGEGQARATRTAAAGAQMAKLKGICTAQGSAVAETATYAAGPGIHPVVAFRALTENVYASDARAIDASWSPQRAEQTELVACLDERWSTIESCPYTGRESGVTKTLDRQQHQIKLRLVASRSGQTVAEELFTGTAPRACQDEESFSVNATSATVQGDPVALSAVQGWLKTFVAP